MYLIFGQAVETDISEFSKRKTAYVIIIKREVITLIYSTEAQQLFTTILEI